MKGSTQQRAKDNAAFLAEAQDYSESVDALDRALVVLQKQNYDRPASSAALIQVAENAQMPAKAKAIISSFVGMMGDDASDAPETHMHLPQVPDIPLDLPFHLSSPVML
jgi:hypothetical protein